jgi:Protein of unknown function (DUF3800)
MKFSFFIDESYQAPETKRQPYFYLLATVCLSADQNASLREYLPSIASGGALHATDLARSAFGRNIIEQVLAFVVEKQLQLQVTYSTVLDSDRLAEAARRSHLLVAFKEAAGHSALGATAEIYMDRRMPGYQSNADERTIRAFRQSSDKFRNISVESATSHSHPGIVLADFSVWAFRQKMTGRNADFWNLLEPVAQVREIK